ncbi:MAG: hypothetical protein HOP33_18995 [Verrucomicrobia bacterium]|nr:hypothetical protein [Verrucomicrobiota bacterium]
MQFLRSLLLKHWRLIAVGATITVIARLVVPCPLQGKWVGSYTSGHLCADHAFLRFDDRYATFYHGDLDPDFTGIYEKVGWNTYSLKYSQTDKSPYTIHVGWVFMHMTQSNKSEGNYWFHRDLNIREGRRIIRAAQANARHAKERIHLLNPGMAAPEVWETLGLSNYRTPRRSAYLTQDVYSAQYLLSPGEILHCEWNMTTNPPALLKADFTGWPEGI